MSTRLSMRMTCALLAGVAATVGFATPVVAQSSDLSSSFSKPSKPEAPKPKATRRQQNAKAAMAFSILSSLHQKLPSTMWFCTTYTTFKSSQSQWWTAG